jgi:hypothetical protein
VPEIHTKVAKVYGGKNHDEAAGRRKDEKLFSKGLMVQHVLTNTLHIAPLAAAGEVFVEPQCNIISNMI